MLKVGNYGRILELYFPTLKQYPRIQLDNTPYPFPLRPTQTQVSWGKANPNKSQVKFRNRQALIFFMSDQFLPCISKVSSFSR